MLAHLVDKEDFSQIENHCSELCDSSEIVLPLAFLEESVSLLWPFVGGIYACRGPYTKADRTGRRGDICRRLASCFPLGMNRPKKPRQRTSSSTKALVRHLLVELFSGDFTIPLVTSLLYSILPTALKLHSKTPENRHIAHLSELNSRARCDFERRKIRITGIPTYSI